MRRASDTSMRHPDAVLEIWPWPRLGVSSTGDWVHSVATPVAGSSAFCRVRESFIHRRIDAACPSVTALMRRVRTGVEAALSPDDSEEMRPKYRKARPSQIFER